VLGLFGFTFVLLINQLFLLARQTIEKRVPLQLVLGFVLAELPRILVMTLPMGFLLAVLVGIGRLASQHEIVALRATGIGPLRLFRPVALLALLIGLAAFGMAHFLEPIGYAHRRALGLEVMRTRDLSREITPGVFYNELPGAVLYARSAGETPTQGRIFEGVLLYQEAPDESYAALIVARKGRGVFDHETGRISLLLDLGERHLWGSSASDDYHVLSFKQHTLSFPPDVVFRALARGTPVRHKSAIGIDLWRFIRELHREEATTQSEGLRIALGTRIRKAELEFQRRWCLPVAVVLLGLVAFPLAARTSRGGRFVGLTQALLIILVHWLLMTIGFGMAERGSWPVWLGAWLPHLVIGAWALYLWIRLLRGRDEGPGWLNRIIDASRRRRSRRRSGNGRRRRSQRVRPVLLNRLDAYLSLGHIKMTVAALFVLAVLVLAIDVKEAIEEVPTGTSVPWDDVATYAWLSLPGRLRFLLPIATLMGVMVSLAALSRGSELIAMRSCGVGPLRIAAPLIAVTLGISLLFGAMQETIVPSTEQESREARDRLTGRPTAADVQTGRRWLFGESGHLWAYIGWDSRRDSILAPWVVVVDLDSARILERIEAREAVREPGGWRFESGVRRSFSTGTTMPFHRFEQHETVFRDDPELFREARTQLLFGRSLADQMSFRELLRHIRRMARTGYADPSPLLVGLHEKLAQPLLPLLMVVFGIPLMVSGNPRKGSLYGFGLALLISFAFWGAWAATTAFGREGVLSPPFAVWLPPALLASSGLVLLVRAR
ncbi:MAG: LptF/LptG family permease, partial [Acidobacteriota bacterium]|nr:LptF/LptG family permease [Acidobacteriota bacterium]